MYHDMVDLKTHRNYEYLELTIHQSKIIRVSTKHCRLQRVLKKIKMRLLLLFFISFSKGQFFIGPYDISKIQPEGDVELRLVSFYFNPYP